MDSTDQIVLKRCIGWRRAGYRVALATVVQTWGSAPRPVGSWVAIREDGLLVGSVSGGCVEDDLIDRVREELLALERPQLVTYGVSREEAARFGLPCGGTVRVLVEPRPDLAVLCALCDRLEAKRMTLREVDVESGRAVLLDAGRDDAMSFGDGKLRTVYGPRWRLVIIGAGHLSRYVCQFALAADYEVVVVDPREEYADGLDLKDVDLRRGMPDDVILELNIDNHTAITALTHDPKLDDMALLEALKSPAFYVGALGSRVNTAKRRERLRMFDLTEEEIGRLQGPVGLYIGANTPPEMALSIMAEITSVKHSVPVLQKRQIAAEELELRRGLMEAHG